MTAEMENGERSEALGVLEEVPGIAGEALHNGPRTSFRHRGEGRYCY